MESNTAPLSPSAQKVQDALNKVGLTLQVVELPASTRTAVEAATAVGCTVAQIAKSLIFKTKQTNRPVLVIASGSNRVSEQKVGATIGEPIEKADADFVRSRTGFVIGGVAPVGHTETPIALIDRDLMRFDVIWASAGTPHAVFRLTPADLVKMIGVEPIDVV